MNFSTRWAGNQPIESVLSELTHDFEEPRAKQIAILFQTAYIDQKHRDYAKLVEDLSTQDPQNIETNWNWESIVTRKWAPQFGDERHDLPPLEQW